MKKKLVLLSIALVLMLSFAACIRYEATITIHSDGTADVSSMFALSDSISSMGGDASNTGLSEEEIAAYREKGFTYEEYKDEKDGFSGYVLTRKGIDLKAQESSSEASGLEDAVNVDFIQIDGNHAVVDYVPLSEDDYDEVGSYFSSLESYGGYMRFTLELPSKPTEHNATTVSSDGKTLTWDLTKMKAGDKIHAEFDLTSGPSILAWLLPVIGALVVIAIVVAVILIRKKKSGAEKPAEEQPAAAHVPAETEPEEEARPDAETETEGEAPEDDDGDSDGDGDGDGGGDGDGE